MKNLRAILTLIFISSFGFVFGDSFIGNLGSTPILVVNGQPTLILGGELGNSSATSPEDIETNFKKIKEGGLNSVLVPAYWELIEPHEGEYDFSLIDSVIDTARNLDLNVVFLWFGAWKNSMSCYAPEWVKRDLQRFPRARCSSGKPLEILSSFSENVADSDLKAFETLLNHIKQTDTEGKVIMIQVENEIGMLEEARDHSDSADKEYAKGVPEELTLYLKMYKDSLHPRIAEKWNRTGNKMRGSWKEVFGDDIYTDEIFMAWNYGKYVERLAEKGKKILNVPYYLNAALDSRGRKPGEYPSAGPLAHLKDIWKASAPSIDFISPDIYDSGFQDWVAQYALKDNILFIPEVKRDLNNTAQAYYIIGHHGALGISPFSIENGDNDYYSSLSSAYAVLNNLTPLLARQDKGLLKDGVILSTENPNVLIEDGNARITLSHYYTLPWDPKAADKSNWNDQGCLILKIAPEEYIIAGSGIVAKFEHELEETSVKKLGEDGFADSANINISDYQERKTPRIGLAKVEEVTVNPDGTLNCIRTLNGDETHQGRHVRIPTEDNKILHIKTYTYE